MTASMGQQEWRGSPWLLTDPGHCYLQGDRTHGLPGKGVGNCARLITDYLGEEQKAGEGKYQGTLWMRSMRGAKKREERIKNGQSHVNGT